MNNEQPSVFHPPESESSRTLIGEPPVFTLEDMEADFSMLEECSEEFLITFCNAMSQHAGAMVQIEFASRWQALRHAWAAGRVLVHLKPKVGHGKWLRWLRDNLPHLSEDSVHRYVKLAKQYPTLETLISASRHHQSLEIETVNNRASRKKTVEATQVRATGWEAVKTKAERLTVLIKKTMATDGQPTDQAFRGAFEELQSALQNIGKPCFIPPLTRAATVKSK